MKLKSAQEQGKAKVMEVTKNLTQNRMTASE
jgi:hypothetical protein